MTLSLDKLVYSPTLVRTINFLDSAAGREKVLRLCQYLARLIASQALDSPLVFLFLKRIQIIITLARKPFRFLNSLKHWRQFLVLAGAQIGDKQLTLFKAVQQFGLGCYFAFDGIQWFKLLGLLENKKNDRFVRFAGLYGYRFWLLGLVGALGAAARQLRIAQSKKTQLEETPLTPATDADRAKEVSVERADRIKEVNATIAQSKRSLWENGLDALIALNGAGIVPVTEGVVGAAGVVTSAAKIRSIWAATPFYS